MTSYAAQTYHDNHVAKTRAAVRDEAESCPYCDDHKPVHPTNWQRHMAHYHPDIADPLSYDELRAFETHESVIRAGIAMFYAVGEALSAIRDRHLYRATHATFADYCQDRWQMSRQRAYQLVQAAGVMDRLSTNVDTAELPLVEAHVRPLAQLPEEAVTAAWKVVIGTTPNGKREEVTGAHVQSVTNNVKQLLKTGAIDDGTGNDVRVADIFKANVTEETYERMARQAAHITARSKRERVLAVTATILDVFADEIVLKLPPGTDTSALRAALHTSKPVFVTVYTEKETA